MDILGQLREHGGRYEFTYDTLNLTIRGDYVEWVLEAAAEVISKTEKMQAEGQLEELMALQEFGEADDLTVSSAQFDAHNRFDVVPQCVVTMGTLDYRWVSHVGRKAKEGAHNDQPIERLKDIMLTKDDPSFDSSTQTPIEPLGE